MKLPKTIYVYEDGDRDDSWLVANGEIDMAAPDVGEVRRIGVYELVREKVIKTKVVME